MRHAAYSFPTNYDLYVRIIKKTKNFKKIRYNNITPPSVSQFNSLVVTHTSNFSKDINVKYVFEFIPSYDFFIDTIIFLKMNTV